MEYIGFIAGSCTTICFIPQVWKTIHTKNTDGISLAYFTLLNIGVTLWLIYGIVKKDPAIIVSNFCTLMLAIIVLFYKVKNVILYKESI